LVGRELENLEDLIRAVECENGAKAQETKDHSDKQSSVHTANSS